jgi:hypothetical protein
MEFDIALKLNKPIYCFLTEERGSGTPSKEIINQIVEPADQYQLQLYHRQSIKQNNRYYKQFSTIHDLKQQIANIQFRLQATEQMNLINELTASVNAEGKKYIKDKRFEPLGTLFKGRSAFIENIRRNLTCEKTFINSDGDAPLTKRLALSGLGGVGKTRTAIEYALKYKEDYRALLFVVADSPENLKRNLASLTGPMLLNLKDLQQGPEEDRVAAALNWLIENPGWYLILDNVDTLEAKDAVLDVLSQFSGGHLVITSRLSDREWVDYVESLELDILKPEDAKDFLLERTPHRKKCANDEKDAAELITKLGGLAIALEQAGAYIDYSRTCSIGVYLNRWITGENIVRKWSKTLRNYPKSVTVTWDTTMNVMGKNAVELLRILSWFTSSPIPQAISTTKTALSVLQNFTNDPCNRQSFYAVEDALIELASFSMLKTFEVDGEPCISIHGVVLDVTKDQIEESKRDSYLIRAVKLFTSFAPKESYRYEKRIEWRLLIPHCEILWEAMEKTDDKYWDTDLIDMLALYYMSHDQNEKAITLQRVTLELKTKRLKPLDPSLLLAKNDLALMLPYCAEKEKLYQEALEGRIKVHTEESEETAETLHNYALYLKAARKLIDSKEMMQRAKNIHNNVNGPFHWRTLMAEQGLATIIYDLDEKEAAFLLLDNNVEKKRKHLGLAHDDTLNALDIRAEWYENEKEYQKAELLRIEYIEGAKAAFGEEHRNTLQGIQKLVNNLYFQNRISDAYQLQLSNIEIQEKLLGPTYIDTLRSINIRGYSYFNRKDFINALADFEKAMTRVKTQKDPNPEFVITVFENILNTFKAMGDSHKCKSYFNDNYDYISSLIHLKNCDPLQIRGLALLAFELKEYIRAKELLTVLLEKGFELPGTYCHLTRVSLVLNDLTGAALQINLAWTHRKDAAHYILARILWFKLCLSFLEAGPVEDVQIIVGKLRTILQSEDVIMDWHMQPVLDNLKPKLQDNDHVFLTALVAAMSKRENLVKLDAFPMWKEAQPEPIELKN